MKADGPRLDGAATYQGLAYLLACHRDLAYLWRRLDYHSRIIS